VLAWYLMETLTALREDMLIWILLVIWIGVDRRCHVFTFVGGPISWRSMLQPTVALSPTEAELMAARETVK